MLHYLLYTPHKSQHHSHPSLYINPNTTTNAAKNEIEL